MENLIVLKIDTNRFDGLMKSLENELLHSKKPKIKRKSKFSEALSQLKTTGYLSKK